MLHNGVWHDTILKEVWYVPDASAHPFSIKACVQNGHSTPFNKNKIVICRVDGTTAASVKLVNILSVLKFGYVFHDTLQKSTWQRKQKRCKYGIIVLSK
jgi:hypothetical protein